MLTVLLSFYYNCDEVMGLLHLLAILVVVLHTVVCCCSMIYSNKGVKKRDETLMIPVGGKWLTAATSSKGGKEKEYKY